MASLKPTGDLLDMFRRYLRQETVDPLRSVGRYLLFGISGSILIGTGLVMLSIGALRLVQSWEALEGSWSWAPYLIVAVALGCVSALSLSRIGGGRGLSS